MIRLVMLVLAIHTVVAEKNPFNEKLEAESSPSERLEKIKKGECKSVFFLEMSEIFVKKSTIKRNFFITDLEQVNKMLNSMDIESGHLDALEGRGQHFMFLPLLTGKNLNENKSNTDFYLIFEFFGDFTLLWNNGKKYKMSDDFNKQVKAVLESENEELKVNP